MYDLNNRQLATAIWIVFAIITVAKNQRARQNIREASKFLFSKKTAFLLIPLLFYTSLASTLISYAMFATNLMRTPPVFSTVTWVLLTGAAIFDKLQNFSQGPSTYVRRFISLIAPPALLSTVLNSVSFPLWGELMLVPILAIAALFILSESFQSQRGIGIVIGISILLMSGTKLTLEIVSGEYSSVDVIAPLIFSAAMGLAYLVYIAIALWHERWKFLSGGQSKLITCDTVEFAWPLTVPVAKVFCNQRAVWLMARGVLYPVNGTATGYFDMHGIRNSKLESIWKLDKSMTWPTDSGSALPRVNIAPIIIFGLALETEQN